MKATHAVAVLLATTVVGRAEILFSDSFEGPSRVAWRQSWGPVERSQEYAYDGKTAIKETLEDEHGLSVWWVDIPVEPGATYRATAWVYVPSQERAGIPALSFNRLDWSSLVADSTTERDRWVPLTVQYVNDRQTRIRLQLFQLGQAAGLGGSVMYWDSVVVERESGETTVANGIRINPYVVEGLEVTPAGGMSVRVAPGKIEVDGVVVEVPTETVLELARPRVIRERDWETTLTDVVPSGYGQGTPLPRCMAAGITLADCLAPESLQVKREPGPEGAGYAEGVDWRADKKWARIGRIPGGAIGADTRVFVDYDWGLQRVDTIQVRSDGTVSLRVGGERLTCPEPPQVDEYARGLCNIYLPPHCHEITADLIYPIGPPFPSASQEELERNAARVPRSREKLERGGDFTLLFWGDSVTCGGDASSPEKAFPLAFTIWLRSRYPQAHIRYVNAGTGGWNSASKLPLFEEEVIAHKPDLVVIEFVNDMGMDRATIFANYTEAVSRIRAIGGEVIILTPHFVRPDWMPADHMRTPEVRPAVGYLKEFAEENEVGLADASRRWAHLWVEGLPYMTLLYNGINHPDDRGHWLFVEELQKFFQ